MSPEQLFNATDNLNGALLRVAGPFYLGLGVLVLLFTLGMALSPLGRRRFGRPDERPAYGTWTWVAMLYSAGMGSGLILRAVQEPTYYFTHPPVPGREPGTLALQYTYFHWGFTPWAFYAAVALLVGWAHFRRGRPLRVSAALPARLRRPLPELLVGLVVILATIFGILASVGLGSGQIMGGIEHLSGQPWPVGYLLGLILALGACSLVSAWTGLRRGISVLSNINLLGAFVLLIWTVWHVDPAAFGQSFGGGLWAYLRDFISMSLGVGDFGRDAEFLRNWTVFYWAFWLAWAPFTGLFIARISRGRTVRQFLLGVLLIPSFGTFVWFTAFSASIFGAMDSYAGQYDELFTATYYFLDTLPGGTPLSYFTLFILCTFLITSVDSAIYVLSILTDGGRERPRPGYKILWGITLPVLTTALVWVGGDALLRAASNLLTITALPFGVVLLGLMGAFVWERLTD